MTPQKLQNDLYKFIRSIEKDFLDLNKDQIENQSKDIFGNPLGFYSKSTEIISKGKKKAGEPFSGVDSGDWFKGFYMQEVSGVLRFRSKDSKSNLILSSESWLSNEVFGLSDENLQKVIIEKLLPFFIENSRNYLDI